MTASITYSDSREAFVISGVADQDRYRLLVPRALLDDELGDDANDEMRRGWIETNLPNILSAYTARTDGGWVKSPWNRVLVEEVT